VEGGRKGEGRGKRGKWREGHIRGERGKKRGEVKEKVRREMKK